MKEQELHLETPKEASQPAGWKSAVLLNRFRQDLSSQGSAMKDR